MAYDQSHYSDPHPMLYSIVAPAALRKLQRSYKLPPAALLLLLAVDLVRKETVYNASAVYLETGWLSKSLVRAYVRKLEAAGYLQRLPPRRRAARQLLLTTNGLGIVNQLKRDMRESCRKLVPAGRWPKRF